MRKFPQACHGRNIQGESRSTTQIKDQTKPPVLSRLRLLFPLLLLGAGVAQSTEIQLYDPNDPTQGDMPQDQGWLEFVTTNGSTPVAVTGGTRLDSSAGTGSGANEAGYFNKLPIPFVPGGWFEVNPSFPTLDSTVGFSLSFELEIHTENHGGNTNRAGFSAILLGQDERGLELAFWEDEIFAYKDDPLFVHGEGVTQDTTLSSVLYELTILGTDYFLTAGGNEILNGETRDYSAFSGTVDPYEIPSFVFLGDDTDSAYADFTLGGIWVDDDPFAASVPAPATWVLALVGLAVLGRNRASAKIYSRKAAKSAKKEEGLIL